MTASGQTSLARAKVLMLEDDPTMRDAVRTVLRAAGCQDVLQTGDGNEALRLFDGRPPDLVLCDCQMQPMDGMTFLRKLREHPLGKEVPVIMLTANQNVEDAWEARQLRVAAWLVKPVSAQNVAAQVAATLGRLPPRVQENVLDSLVAEYESRLPHEVLALQSLAAELRPGETGLPEELKELHRRLHNVKGQAGSLGYALLGHLAAPLHDVLAQALLHPDAAEPLREDLLKLLRVGLSGMKLVADRQLRGEGGAAGARMREQLGAYAKGLQERLAAAKPATT